MKKEHSTFFKIKQNKIIMMDINFEVNSRVNHLEKTLPSYPLAKPGLLILL